MFARHNTVHDEKNESPETTGTAPTTNGRHAAETAAAEHAVARDAGYNTAHDRFGGMNAGADFFGWLVAVASAVLMMGALGALTAAATTSRWAEIDWTQDPSTREASVVGIVAGIAVLFVLAVSYYAGGYVAGRMSRFDGARQGFGVWLISLVAMALCGGIGAAFGAEYNVLDRIDLPALPFSDYEASIGAAVTGAVLLVVTLVAALAGGKAGRAYHHRVDDAHLEMTSRG